MLFNPKFYSTPNAIQPKMLFNPNPIYSSKTSCDPGPMGNTMLQLEEAETPRGNFLRVPSPTEQGSVGGCIILRWHRADNI